MYTEQATFFRAALLLGLVRGTAVVQWSDAVLARDPDAPAPFVDIASTSPDDLSALRHALYPLCTDRESAAVVHGIIGLVSQDLTSGRRSFDDTITVLSQVRRFMKLDSATDDSLKTLLVEVWRARHGLGADWDVAQLHVSEWLRQRELIAADEGLIHRA